MSTERPQQPLSLIERLKKAAKERHSILHISSIEFRHELQRLTKTNNEEGIRALFDAYLAWKFTDTKTPRGEIREKVFEDFSYLAMLQDRVIIDTPTGGVLRRQDTLPGKIQEFLIHAVRRPKLN